MSSSMVVEKSGLPPGRVQARPQFAIRPKSRIGITFAFLWLCLVLGSTAAQAESQGSQAPLDLNRATAQELEALPGIGAVKAAAILAVRDTKGGFQTMEELEAVRGIGPALVKKLRPLVVVGKTAASSGKTTRKDRR